MLHPEVHLQIKPLPNHSAEVKWESPSPPSAIRIAVDPDKEGRLKCVIHELLHVVFNDLTETVDYLLEEEIILALERALDAYVRKSPRRLASWRKAIDWKLANQAAPEDD